MSDILIFSFNFIILSLESYSFLHIKFPYFLAEHALLEDAVLC